MILRSYLATRSWNVVRSLFFVVCRSLFVGESEILAERKYLFLYLHFIDDMGNYKIVSNGHEYESNTYQGLRVLGF